MGTLLRLVPPAPALAAALGVDEETAERAFRAEVAYYVEHHLEGRDARMLDDLRDRCAAVIAEVAGADRATAREALLGAIRFEPFEDAPPVLAELRSRGLRLVVVSNWDCSLPDVLARVGLLDLVDEVIVSAVVGVAKPDQRIFGAALEAARCEPGEALHVGDSFENDVQGAEAAGIRAVLLERPAGSLADIPPLLS
jgi:HAD superfamily hydrolase (TIGR01549 family)